MPSAAKRLSAVGLLSSIASRPLPSAVSAAAVALSVCSFIDCSWFGPVSAAERNHARAGGGQLGLAAIRAPIAGSLSAALQARPLGMALAALGDGHELAINSTV